MTKTKIIFVRHWRTDYNLEWKYDWIWNAKLTEVWKNQALEIKEIFKNHKIKAIYSSPLQRCIDTITPLSVELGIEIEKKEELIEIQSPDLQDKVFSCKNYKWENWYGWWETIKDANIRVEKIIKEIIEKHKWETVVVCAHWDTTFLWRNFFHKVDYDTQKYTSWLYLENNPEKFSIENIYWIEEK